MARARNIKPEVFADERVADCDPLARLLYVFLPMIADREGRLEDNARRIKAMVLAYDATTDAEPLLLQLATNGLILRYESAGARFIQLLDWHKHQSPHMKEQASTIPAPDMSGASLRQAPIQPGTSTEVAALIPDSGFLIPDSRVGTPAPPAAEPPPTKKLREAAGTRLPDDWTLPDEYRAFCVTERPDLDPDKTADKFADHWRAEPERKAIKADWLACWRNWVRSERPPASVLGPVASMTVPARAGIDPALQKIEEDARKATKPPPEEREKWAAIRAITSAAKAAA